MQVLRNCAELRPSNHKAKDLKTSERRNSGSGIEKMVEIKKQVYNWTPADR